MSRRWRIGLVLVVGALLIGALGYTGYVGYEGSRLFTAHAGAIDCRTPDVQFGWSYEAINYNIADDALLKTRNPDMQHCDYVGTPAGDEIVTSDGIRVAGWYIPAADGAGPTAPTIVMSHGFTASKAQILPYGEGLHESFNLVAFDHRNSGRSTGTQTIGGVLEARDVRAVVDWLVRTKHPSHIGLLGNSLGAFSGLAEAVDDPRIEALVLDSMHTRTRYQVEQRLVHAGHPMYPGTWAVFIGTWIRTGVDVGSADPEDEIARFAGRPLLLTHGTADNEDLPERTQAFYEQALTAGVKAEIEWCANSGHNATAGMPVNVCRADYAKWVRDFFTRALA
jgi:pimeloyl-ACP methyl ester carboxylesterase